MLSQGIGKSRKKWFESNRITEINDLNQIKNFFKMWFESKSNHWSNHLLKCPFSKVNWIHSIHEFSDGVSKHAQAFANAYSA